MYSKLSQLAFPKLENLDFLQKKGLDYSDVNFAPAKFRAAAKNEKLGNVRCENLVKKLGNFTKKMRNI